MIAAVDLLPTFCAVAGAKLPEAYQADGQNMLPALLDGQVTGEGAICWEWLGPERTNDRPWLAVRESNGKSPIGDDYFTMERYDLAGDRDERSELAKQHPEIVKQLAA